MGEWWNVTIVIVAGLLTILNLVDKLVGWAKAVSKPQVDLEERVVKLEKTVEFEYKSLLADYEMRFKRDLQRIEEMEKSNKLTQKALLALMRHAIDGNNTDKLKTVADELSDYIVER